MSKYRRKHNSTVPNGRFLQPAELERLLHGDTTPNVRIRAAKPDHISEGALEARRLMEQAAAALARQRSAQA
ncbi:hypothetical protein HNP48_002272 [Acidovorax soli]|uniref:Uncharacterized protein n=1 Tax=Acidovorax soli TaxID=592050 RepID=A0A7X0U9J1_9BURK|nr:hypothetical protein [Acidovorax soli]MBB6559605.1 hypothetical protein [Acidovorax soli]